MLRFMRRRYEKRTLPGYPRRRPFFKVLILRKAVEDLH